MFEDKNLDEFQPIKRGFNTRAYYWRLAWFYFAMAVVYAFIAPWPLVEEMAVLWRIAYAVSASAILFLVQALGGGAIKGMLLPVGYYFLFYVVLMISEDENPVSYIYGILCFFIHIPIGGVIGWTMAQQD